MTAMVANGQRAKASDGAPRVGHWTLVIWRAFRVIHESFVNNPD
jgi:hypothetical protein